MSSEFFDEEAAVLDLKSRLRRIRDEVKPFIHNNMTDPSLISKEIREEIVQIYDEHGGIDLLSNLTKLTFNSINTWHRRWQYNPYVFRTTAQYKTRKSNTLIKKVLNPPPIQPKNTKSQQVIFKHSTATEKIRNKITADQEQDVKKIKQMIQECVSQGQEMGENIADEVRKMFCEIGNSREIAILLGISQEIIEEWVETMTLDDL